MPIVPSMINSEGMKVHLSNQMEVNGRWRGYSGFCQTPSVLETLDQLGSAQGCGLQRFAEAHKRALDTSPPPRQLFPEPRGVSLSPAANPTSTRWTSSLTGVR
jgi:hypothetical protein